jgi:tetratricopeptide (TPR) repeat protein
MTKKRARQRDLDPRHLKASSVKDGEFKLGQLPTSDSLIAGRKRKNAGKKEDYDKAPNDLHSDSSFVYTFKESESSQSSEKDVDATRVSENQTEVDSYIQNAIKLAVSGKLESAGDLLLKAERISPDNIDVLYNMAMLQMDYGRYEIAYNYSERFLVHQPNSSEMLSMQGYCSLQMGNIHMAESKISQALCLNPNDPHCLTNMAIVLLHKSQHSKALVYANRALTIEPTLAMGYITLANILIDQGDIDEGIDRLEVAKCLDTSDKLADFNLSFAYFAKGDRKKGYKHYEYRYLKKDPILTHANASLAVDSLARYRDIALLSEQGFGDTVQFCRYAKWLVRNQRFSSVTLYVQEELVSLIRRSLPDVIVKPHTVFRESHEVGAIPLLSCPYVFGENAEDDELHAEYLVPSLLRQQYWDKLFVDLRLDPHVKKIGLVWQGNPQAEITSNRGRSLPLNLLEPIARQSDVAIVGLQKGFGLVQYYECGFRDEFVKIQEKINSSLDFEDTMAILACCDLLITVDTVVAHIAGAMGLPVWLLLSHKPDWRWGGNGTELFWYKRIKSFKQKADGDWEGVVQEVLAELAENRSTGS